jgi:uncharacterized ferredoxin-like protein
MPGYARPELAYPTCSQPRQILAVEIGMPSRLEHVGVRAVDMCAFESCQEFEALPSVERTVHWMPDCQNTFIDRNMAIAGVQSQ